MVVSSALFIGVVLAPMLKLTWIVSFSWLMTGIAFILIAIVKQRLYLILLAIIGGGIIGLWRGTDQAAALSIYQPLYGKTMQISGTVADDVDSDKQGNIVVRLKNISINKHQLSGMIWASLATKKAPIQRSDQVRLEGKLQAGFGTFAASMYRANIVQIERPQPGDIALHVRDWFSGAVRKAIPEPESSLGVGYLVGQRRNLPSDLDQALRTAGLTHVVVASGYNLTILIRLARRLFEKVSKYLSALVSGGLIVSFIAVTGLSPSMSRAGLVTGLSLLAWYYGRKIHPLVILLFAVAVTVLFNPSYAWGDVGWELSFAAFGGVMLLAPLLQRFYFGDKPPGTIRQILGETMSAWLCTLPILIITFGYVSNVAIVANLLVLPLVPLAMLLVFIAGVGSLLLPAISVIIGFPAYLLLGYMTRTTEYLASLPWAKGELTITGWPVTLAYAAIIVFGTFMWWRTKLVFRDTSIVE